MMHIYTCSMQLRWTKWGWGYQNITVVLATACFYSAYNQYWIVEDNIQLWRINCMVMAKMPGLYSTRSFEERAHWRLICSIEITSECMVTAVSGFSELVRTLIKVMHNYHPSCHNSTELAQILVCSPLYTHPSAGCNTWFWMVANRWRITKWQVYIFNLHHAFGWHCSNSQSFIQCS